MGGRQAEEYPDAGYGEASKFAAHLDRGWALLDRGDVAAARTSVTHAQEVRPDDPDAVVLQGAIALADGDADESLRCYDRAIELDPEYLEPYAAAAQVCLFDLDDPVRALRYCEDAIDLEGLAPLEVLDVQLMAAECELWQGDNVGAEQRLNTCGEVAVAHAALELAAGVEDPAHVVDDPDPDRAAAARYLTRDVEGDVLEDDERTERINRAMHFAVRLSRLRLDLGQIDAGLALLDRLVALFPRDPDAWYLFGEAQHRHGDLRRGCVASLRALELDRDLPTPGWVPPAASIRRLVLDTIAQCRSPKITSALDESGALHVLVEELPPAELVLEGVDTRALVLALASKSPGPAEPMGPLVLTGLVVYRRNVARFGRDLQSFEQELRLSVLDELAVFFSLTEAERDAMGLSPAIPSETQPAEDAEDVVDDRRRRRRMRLN